MAVLVAAAAVVPPHILFGPASPPSGIYSAPAPSTTCHHQQPHQPGSTQHQQHQRHQHQQPEPEPEPERSVFGDTFLLRDTLISGEGTVHDEGHMTTKARAWALVAADSALWSGTSDSSMGSSGGADSGNSALIDALRVVHDDAKRTLNPEAGAAVGRQLCRLLPPLQGLPFCLECFERDRSSHGLPSVCSDRLHTMLSMRKDADIMPEDVPIMGDVALHVNNITLLWIAVRAGFRHRLGDVAWDLSEAAMSATADSPPHRRVIVFERVNFLFQEKRFSQAAGILEGVIDARDTFASLAGGDVILNQLPMCYLRMTHSLAALERAVMYIRAARLHHPGHYGLRHNLGLLLMSNRRWREGSAEMVLALAAELSRWPIAPYKLGVDGCSRWTLLDWNDLSHPAHPTTLLLRPRAIVLQDYATLVPVGGRQEQPLVLGFRGDYGCLRDGECTAESLFSLHGYDTQGYFVSLANAWVENAPGSSAIVMHSSCHFHLFSSQQVQPLAAIIPTAAEITATPQVRLSCAYHLHWMHGYYQFVGEMLPKLLIMKAAGELGTTCPALLVHTAYAEEFLRLLGIDTAAVRWLQHTERYFVETLHVLPFRTNPALDMDTSDRLSVAPAFWLRRLRRVSGRPHQ